MGNANGREEGGSGGGKAGEESASRGEFDGKADRVGRANSVDSMGSTPPGSPGRMRSPLLFAPQAPLAPLQKVADVPQVYNNVWMNNTPESFNLPPEKGIPTLLTWSYGGNDVAVEGSWDNWTTRKILQKSGKDHSILLVLPAGIYHYGFIVDGQWQYISDLPHVSHVMGRPANLLNVTDYVPENLDSVDEFEAPLSPPSSYNTPFPADEDFAKEPPVVPQQLHLSVLGTDSDDEEACSKPRHVVLNHLFIEKGWASQSLVALGLTHRFQSKYVTVVLYKPLKR